MSPCFRLLPLAAITVAAAAAAQSSPVPGTDTAPLATGPLPYRAPLAAYQPFSDEKIVPWKEANDTVGRIGGWRAYARDSQLPGAAPPAAPSRAGKAPAPAAGHGGPANH